jgi:la-related protein 1
LNYANLRSEYYFSLDNLVKDMYLRKHMDSQGFVTLAIIADFNRIKALTQDIDLLKFICQQSHNIEWRLGADGKDRLRKREGWEKWVLEMSQRDPGAQNDGPGEHQYQNLPQPHVFEQQPVSMPNRHVSLPPMSPQSVTSPSNGLAINGLSPTAQDAFHAEPLDPSRFQSSPPSMHKPLHSRHTSDVILPANGMPVSNGAPEAEQDTFSDAEVEKLSVMVRPAGSTNPAMNGATNRTLSNGSIESKGMEGMESLNGIAAGSGPNGAASSHA